MGMIRMIFGDDGGMDGWMNEKWHIQSPSATSPSIHPSGHNTPPLPSPGGGGKRPCPPRGEHRVRVALQFPTNDHPRAPSFGSTYAQPAMSVSHLVR